MWEACVGCWGAGAMRSSSHPHPLACVCNCSIVGYCAHWREMQNDPDLKIVRPQQDYRGVWLRHYAAMDQRASGQHADGLTKLPPSNAYQRRVAGENWQ